MQSALKLSPNDVETHCNLGITLKDLGRLDEAEASYRQAIALRPEDARALLNLSTVLSCMNDLEAETISLQNVIVIDADNLGLIAGCEFGFAQFFMGRL